MKPAVVIWMLAIFGLGSLTTASCLVTRRSEGYTCSTDTDCENNRTCDHGYCVLNACPGPCTSCNLTDRTCTIACSSAQACGTVQCPPGFDCTIQCDNANACGTIDCTLGTACDISCSGMASCGAITCGTGECKIGCTGMSSCGAVSCMQACACDVKCSNAPSCPSTTCPQPSGTFCTKDGTSNTVCDSSGASCNACM